MRKTTLIISLFFVAAFAMATVPQLSPLTVEYAHAAKKKKRSRCLPYGPKTVTLTGKVTELGGKNKQPILKIMRPICVDKGAGKGQAQVKRATKILLKMPEKPVGKRISAVGTLVASSGEEKDFPLVLEVKSFKVNNQY